MPEIVIDKVGSLGDGMGQLNGGTVFVPGTLAGERVSASGEPPRLQLDQVLTPSPDRVPPLCRHFGTCGGCSLQHMSSSAMLAWKRAEVANAFSRAGLKVEIETCVASSPHSRRRVTFTARREAGKVKLGFHERGEVAVVDIQQCPILLPEIEMALPLLSGLAATLLRGNEDIQLAVTACENGIDLNIIAELAPSEEMMAGFVRAFAKSGFLRAGLNGEVIAGAERPYLSFGQSKVSPPPGGFSQTVASAEHAMADVVCTHLKPAKHVADLFSGSGTFALRLAKQSRVHAVEADAAALSALAGADQTDGLKSVTTEQRDLFELPLMASELKTFDGLCVDPPRAGAEEQIGEIAKTVIKRVAYVSCNPVTLARDAKTLVNAGYKLERVVPVDQFVFSPHIEAVALFSRKPEKAQRSIFR